MKSRLPCPSFSGSPRNQSRFRAQTGHRPHRSHLRDRIH